MASPKTILAVGLMSGTSLDGLDGVVVRCRRRGGSFDVQILAHHHKPYPREWREMIHKISDRNLLRESAYFGALWAEEAATLVRRLAKTAKISLGKIDVVGAHGQTVAHAPDPSPFLKHRIGITIQLGDLSRLAQRTGILTVGNFRTADIAAGGQGAPLVPHAHRILFSKPDKTIAVQNLGGIGNVTLLKNERVLSAFDTGPGNIWIDTVTRWHTNSRLTFDRNGNLAKRGKPNRDIIQKLLRHPYFSQRPPKSCGWEEFGDRFLRKFRAHFLRLSLEDAVATVTYATARAIGDAYRKWVYPSAMPSILILAGGGAKNSFLKSLIARELPKSRVITSADVGVPADQLESICFALLAIKTIHGEPNNEPASTGAASQVILGNIALP